MTPIGRNTRGFTLIESLFATVIVLYMLSAMWGVYIMVQQWWAETLPRIEAQRTARIAVSAIVEGIPGEGLGTVEAKDGPSFERRYGLAWAIEEPDTSTAGIVYFKLLTGDTATTRGFKIMTSGNITSVYYKTSGGTWSKIPGTSGITDLTFEPGYDALGKVTVKVTATVEKEVHGTRSDGYVITCTYSDYAYLRNII